MAETIEIFLQEEVKELIHEPEQLDEWNKKVEELGLTGQKSLTKENKSPVPFLYMNQAMVNTYKTLCPVTYVAKDYNKSAIPLRVLSVLALCFQEKYFRKVEIWTTEDAPDPIAVGFIDDSWNGPRYIIARWGDELCSFPELQKRAIELMKKTTLSKLHKAMSECRSQIDNFDSLAELHVNGEQQYFKS